MTLRSLCRNQTLLWVAGVPSLVVGFASTWLVAQQASPAQELTTTANRIVVARGLNNVSLQDGPALAALAAGAVRPLALDAGDFDEDGVQDMVAGALAADGPLLALYRGNADSIYGNDRESVPFFAPIMYELPIAPDFVAAGDFDADGDWDVAVATRGASALAWLPGNGQGEFDAARLIELPAAVTGLRTGELNRIDGLMDLVLSVSGDSGSRLLVFAGPDGALQGGRTEIDLPGPSRDLAVGQLDDDWFGDLAVVVGNELLIYHGDGETMQSDSLATSGAKVSRHALGVHPVAIAAGNFDRSDPGTTGLGLIDGDGAVHTMTRRRGTSRAWQLATVGRSSDGPPPWSRSDEPPAPVLASARISASGTDDLIVIDRARYRILIAPAGGLTVTSGAANVVHPPAILDLATAPMAVLPMRLDGDAAGDLVIFQEHTEAPSLLLATAGRTLVVDSPADEPDCNVTDNVCRIGPVDATGKCVGGCTFRAALNEANVNADLDTIQFALGAGTPSIVKQGGADWVATYPVNIYGNTGGATRVHLDAHEMGNTLIVRGGSSTVRNLVITGGSAGVYVTNNGGNIFEGNWIGLDPTGTIGQGNPGQGMLVITPLNTIGGTTSAARNIISASGLGGIEIRNATGNKVLGNFIGTDSSGTVDLGNASSGIYLELAGNTTIGGTVAGARNVISGNDAAFDGGILANISPNLVVQGNYIGTTVTGKAALGNSGPGLRIVSGSTDVIGGTTVAARNVIAANGGDGLILRSINVSAKALVRGNYIGAAADATLLGNAGFGVAVQGTHDNTIGGTASGARNVIAGNGRAGVALQFAGVYPMRNVVRGNSIFSNASLGIDLGADGPTANDACDADNGANGGQNAPIVTSVSGITTIRGTLNSKASTAFVVDFYSSPSDPSGYGEGHTFLGSKNVTTNASCTASFTATFASAVPVGHVVTATATDSAHNTSEFSQGVVAPGAITVTSPNTAVNWGIGTVQRLQWSHNLGAGSLVKIEVSRDGGSAYSVVAASVANGANSGTYNWTVTGPSTSQARIRVTSFSNPSIVDVSNVNFTIAEPFVRVTTPTLSSHVWTIGTTQTIQWSNNLGALEKVLIELSRDGGTTYPVVLFPATPSDGKQSLVIQSAWATPTARVRITWVKNGAVRDSSDQSFPVQ
jgi:hypothetical protein